MELIQCEMQTAPLNPSLGLGRNKPQWRITKILSTEQMYAAIRYENNTECTKKKEFLLRKIRWKGPENKNQFL